MSIIWSFKTARFEVFCEAQDTPEFDRDLSWADAETLDKIDRGVYSVVDWFVGVRLLDSDGDEIIGCDTLGDSVYENLTDFVREHLAVRRFEREHFERTGQLISCGSYFPEMVRAAIGEARRHLRHQRQSLPVMREGA